MSDWISQSPEDQPLPTAVSAQGLRVTDADGKSYIDSTGGPALFALGHGHPEVVDAVKAQFDQLVYGFSMSFSTDVVEQLSTKIVRAAGAEHFGGVFYASSGSEANEHALKAAVQYHVARGEPERTHFIARRLSWHGATLGVLGVSHHLNRRRFYEGVLAPASHVSAPQLYRAPDGIAPDDLAGYYADELEQTIQRVGPKQVAAFIFEPVGGTTGGVLPPPSGYARALREVCDRHGVLMIADEIFCGVGRAGTWRALEPEGVYPDLMTIAKGMSGGYMPLSGCVVSRDLRDTIGGSHGNVEIARTYSGHTAACSAGLAVLSIIERDGLIDKVARDGVYLKERLDATLGQHDSVGDIRGIGFMWGVELVEDRESKEPFDPALKLHARYRDRAMQNGLLTYQAGGIVDGHKGDFVQVSPPYVATRDELDEIVDKVALSIKQAVDDARAAA